MDNIFDDMIVDDGKLLSIDDVFNKVISEIERRLVQTNDYEEYYRYSSKLIAILDKENDKFLS